MIIQKTFSIPPNEPNPFDTIRRKLRSSTNVHYGFILNVHDIQVKSKSISFAGNYIYTIDAEVESFLPELGKTYEAVVRMNRDKAHIAIIMDCMTVIFHSDQTKQAGDVVKCVLKEIKYQCGTYRAVAELQSEGGSSSSTGTIPSCSG